MADDSGDTEMLSTFTDSFAYEAQMNSLDLQVMAVAWITAENDPDGIDVEIDDELLSAEELYTMNADNTAVDDDDENKDNSDAMLVDTCT